MSSVLVKPELASQGLRPTDGVRDMILISDIDENGINTNLKVRYKKDLIYVKASTETFAYEEDLKGRNG